MPGRPQFHRLSAVLLLLATLLVSSTPLSAVGPDSINGLLWKDLNETGQLGDTDPSQFGAGPEGPIAGAVVEITGPGGTASQTVGADGLYSFDGLSSGVYSLTITYPTGYRPGPLGPDSDITSASAPAPGDPWRASTTVTLPAGDEIVLDAAVTPLPIVSLDIADLDPGPGVTPAIETGRPNFDTLGACATADNPPTPGDDCAADDGYVRTNDLTTMTFAVTADNIPDPATDPLQNVIFEQIITPSADADVAFDSIPPECRTAGVAPPSSITTNPDGSSVLICNLGAFQNELKLVGVSIKALGTSANGSSFTTEQRVYQVNDAAIPDYPYPAISTEISAAPRFDITKGTSPENPYNRTIYGQTTQRVNPSTGVSEYGVNYYYDITVLYDGSIVGQEALAGPITFSDTIDPNFDGWVMTQCYNLPYPSSLPYDHNATNDWGDRGDWTCTPDYANNEIDISVDNVDTDGDPVPTEGYNGTDFSAGPYVAFAGRIYVWYPLSEFYQQINPAWTYGDDPITGDYPLVNTVTQFDPTSGSGVSNFGDDTEPEHNNVTTTNVPIYDRGGFSKHVGAYEWVDGRVTTEFSNVSAWPCSATSIEQGSLMAGQTQLCSSGDGPIQPGQKTSWWYWFRNNGSIPWPAESLEICDVFDNSTMSLTNWSFGGHFAIRNGGIPANAIIVEFATGNFNDDVANNDWTNQTAAVEGCTAPLNDWTTDPTTLGIDNVGMVRIRIDETIHPEVLPSQYIQTAIPTEARDTYYGGPNDGALIEPGVYLANMANRTFGATPYGTLASDSQLFRPGTYSNSPWGDRLILNRHQVRIDKRTSRDALGDDLLEQVEAGEQVLWSLHPAVTAITDGAIAENVTIVDVLPEYITLDPVCQAAQSMPAGVTLSSATPGPGAGETTLVFDLGDRAVNEPIGVIPVCTISDAFAPPSTDAVNHVEISSDGDVSPESARVDDRPIRIIQTGAFVVGKSVDAPLELQNSTQTWTIGWQNLSQSLPFAPPDAIDVLPYNGDFGNPINGRSEFDSVFSSSLGLVAYLPQPTTNDGAGGLSVTNGTWYYSADASNSISHDPRDASNDLAIGSTNWCTEADMIAAATPCDVLLEEVTAIRFVSDDNLLPNATVSVSYTTAAGLANGSETVTNEPRDRYVNRFAAFSTTFPNQLIRSQEVLVQVLSMSIGDLVFKDVNLDGVYTAGVDQPIPGVDVELYDHLGILIDSTSTNGNGRYIFTELLQGQYEVVIPASESLAGGPLADLLPTVLPTPADDDGNENVDQQARPGVAGAVTSGLVSLDPDVSDDPPLGFEPTGEDVTGIEDPLTFDNFSNLSVDLGFAGDPAIEIIKQVCLLEDTATCDGSNDAHWGEHSDAAVSIPFDGAWRITVNNIGNQQLVDVEVSDPLVPACDATATEEPGLASMLPGESVSYTCTAANLADDLDNVASVTSTAPGGFTPTDDDDASIEAPAAAPSLQVIKYVSDLDANTPPGPAFVPGETVVWTYRVTNTGNVDFNSVDISDDNGTPTDAADDQTPTYVSGDSDGDSVLDTGEVWLFSLTGIAPLGAYVNEVGVTGTGTWDGETFEASDDDPANLFGANPAISIVKSVNSQDANTAPGVALTPGQTAAFTYLVSNTGNTHLTDIEVTDDQGVAVTCPNTILAPLGSMTCTGSATVVAGQYTNIGDVIGTPAAPDGLGGLVTLTDSDGDPLDRPTDDDPANYYGTGPAVSIVKYVNGVDANTTPGVGLTPGDTAAFTYVVTNTGNTHLTDIEVTDDQGVAVTCPNTVLAPDTEMTCTGSATVVAGQYTNIGDVIGTPAAPGPTGDLEPLTNPDGSPVDKPTDNDPANYYGAEPGLDVTKYVAGHDANTAPGIHLPVGISVEWTYVVTNTGNTWLTNVSVTDDQGVTVTCPETQLAPGQSMTCTGEGIVTVGDYTNVGEAMGTPSMPGPDGVPVPLIDETGTALPVLVDDDPANNFGYETGIEILKRVFGEDAPVGEEVHMAADGMADFTYEVTNTGNTWLTELSVTDDRGVTVTCPVIELAPGETTICVGRGPVAAGPYANIGEATGIPSIETPGGLTEVVDPDTGTPIEKPVDDDDANLFGEYPAIELVKVACYQGRCGDDLSVPDSGIIQWQITVTNTGNVPLVDVQITDNRVETCDRTIAWMDPGEVVVITCEAAASVTRTNGAEVKGTPVTEIDETIDGSPPAIVTEVSSTGTATVRDSTSRTLAFTGATTGFLLAIGFWLTIGGWFLLVLSRRRKAIVA